MTKRSSLHAASLGLLAATLLSGAALAQDPQVTLRFSHWSPPQHPMSTISVPEWVSAVEKARKGKILLGGCMLGSTVAVCPHCHAGVQFRDWKLKGIGLVQP